MSNLELKQINKTYDNGFHAVKDFDLKIEDGELYMDDFFMNHIDAKDRDIAMVFQNYALFPHLTVYENISFPLKINKLSKREIQGIYRFD